MTHTITHISDTEMLVVLSGTFDEIDTLVERLHNGIRNLKTSQRIAELTGEKVSYIEGYLRTVL
jgi:hypothetical protein